MNRLDLHLESSDMPKGNKASEAHFQRHIYMYMYEIQAHNASFQ